MAKTFSGFTPNQLYTILSRLGYSGPNRMDEMNSFIMSSPEVSAKVGRFYQKAQKSLETPRMAEGGVVEGQTTEEEKPAQPPVTLPTNLPKTPLGGSLKQLQDAQNQHATLQRRLSENPNDEKIRQQLELSQNKLATLQAGLSMNTPSGDQLTAQTLNKPQSMVTPANVAQMTVKPQQLISQDVGKDTTKDVAKVTQVDETAQAQAAGKPEAETYEATKATDEVRKTLENLEAETAGPSAKATVRGQLEDLMKDFDGGKTPPWASGAMREAMGVMQRRGMGASSIAGQAVVNAAMEAAIGIAERDASTVAQFEMQNLNNRQTTAIFKTQQTVASMFGDQAAENASKQFNASSKNQVNQFFADLETTVSRFNAEQVNGIRQFNVGQKNAMEQFNTNLQALRDQFNAQNSLVIAQANAKWRQDVATQKTKAMNDRNMELAKTINAFSAKALDQVWQKERDIMTFAYGAGESAADRQLQLLLADKQAALTEKGYSEERKASNMQALGYLAGKILFGGGGGGGIFG